MNKTNLMTLIIVILLIAITWYYSQSDLVKEKKKSIEELYSLGTMHPADGTEVFYKGCMNPDAENYNEDATEDDGSCFYNIGCCDVQATNYDASADSCNAPNNNSLTCDYGEGGGWTEEGDFIVVGAKLEETTTPIPCSNSCRGWSQMSDPKCCTCFPQFRDYDTYSY